LLVVGSSPVAQVLTRLGKVMNYRLTVVDPELKTGAPHEADAVIRNLNALAVQITPQTYVVVATHGQFDELALQQALRSPALYVALVASKTRSAAVYAYLVAQGLTASELARLKVPAGLDIHAQGGDEIALSIMAEIVQTRRTTQPIAVAPRLQHEAEGGTARSINIDLLLGGDEPSLAPATAIDPVCGMTVEIASAHYRSEYAGQSYYFCAAGCKLAFDQAPETFVRLAAP
jgi:xanthine dehydrogenase accessory factor